MTFDKPVKIAANTPYIASYFAGLGNYAYDANYFTSTYTNTPLSAPTTAGLFHQTRHLIPDHNSVSHGNYWIDVVFENSVPAPSISGSGPILVVTSVDNTFTTYLPEMLKAEGLNAFATADISRVNATLLTTYDTVVLGEAAISPSQADMFTTWVTAGGNLIAMRPDNNLSSLLGIASASATLADGYILVNTSDAPGTGIVGETIQYHGTSDIYTLNGASAIATLYSDASTSTTNPAVTIRSVGRNGGQAAAFTYDLAKSIIYTRQGNPAYEGQERDGISPNVIRSNDLFYPD